MADVHEVQEANDNKRYSVNMNLAISRVNIKDIYIINV